MQPTQTARCTQKRKKAACAYPARILPRTDVFIALRHISSSPSEKNTPQSGPILRHRTRARPELEPHRQLLLSPSLSGRGRQRAVRASWAHGYGLRHARLACRRLVPPPCLPAQACPVDESLTRAARPSKETVCMQSTGHESRASATTSGSSPSCWKSSRRRRRMVYAPSSVGLMTFPSAIK